MKVHELKAILGGFDSDASVEIQDLNHTLLAIEKVKPMMAATTTVRPGGVIELSERDRAEARLICTIVTRRMYAA